MLSACGKSSNFNVIWGSEDESGDGKIRLAKLYYDRGDYDGAIGIANDLLGVNPNNEVAAILVAYAHLSKGGIDPFALSCKLVTLSTGDECSNHPSRSATSTNTSTKTLRLAEQLADTTNIDQDAFLELLQRSSNQATTSQNSQSTSATDTLKKLSAELLSLTDADYDTLSSETYNKGLFANSPVLKPEIVTDTLRESVNILRNMNAALRAVCPFVDDSTKIEFQNASKTGRYDSKCTATSYNRANTAKAHFVWGFAHLAEAMVYQSILLYSSSSSVNGAASNFESAVQTMSNKSYNSASSLSTLASEVAELNNLIAAVFDTSDGSMLGETLKSLRTVGLSFTALGLPESFSASINQAIDSLDQIAKKMTQTTDQSTKNTQALKTQITENFSKTIATKVGTVYDQQLTQALSNSSLSEQEKTEFQQKFKASTISQIPEEDKKAVFGDDAAKVEQSLSESCTAYDKIAKDLPPDTQSSNKPAVCG